MTGNIVFQQTSPPLYLGSKEAACIYLHMCIFAPITLHTASGASQEHTASDILPGCFALGSCQPQFCTSLPAQFDVVWITFRHTHTPSLAFIQWGNAGRPSCSEGGILARAKYTWQKNLSLSSPSRPCYLKTSLCLLPKHIFCAGWLQWIH